MKLRLSKLIEFQIYYLLVIESLISIVGIPSITRYLLDVNLILMAALSMQKIPFLFKHRDYNKLTGYILFYMISITAMAFIRLVPTGQILWGIRNNFFFIFFFIYIPFLTSTQTWLMMGISYNNPIFICKFFI